MKTIKLTTQETRDWRGAGEEARENIRSALLERNGGVTFKLQSSTGRMLGTVHGTNNIVSGAALGSGNTAPSPASCPCQAYAGTVKGEHHPVCVHRNSWSQGQGITIQNVQGQHAGATHMNVSKPIGTPSGVQHFAVPRLVDGSPNPIATPAVMSLRSPNDCECKAYAKPANADLHQHHYLCPYHDVWKAAHPSGPKPLPSTVDLEQQRRERRKPLPTLAENNEMRANITRDIARGKKPQTPAQEAEHVKNGATPNPDTQMVEVDRTAPVVALAPPDDVESRGDADDHGDTEPPPAPGKRYGIFDLDTRAYMREAIPQEVEEGLIEEQKTGVPLVTIDDQQYAMLEVQFKPVAIEKEAAPVA